MGKVNYSKWVPLLVVGVTAIFTSAMWVGVSLNFFKHRRTQ